MKQLLNGHWDIVLTNEVGLIISSVEPNFAVVIDECVDFSTPSGGYVVARSAKGGCAARHVKGICGMEPELIKNRSIVLFLLSSGQVRPHFPKAGHATGNKEM